MEDSRVMKIREKRELLRQVYSRDRVDGCYGAWWMIIEQHCPLWGTSSGRSREGVPNACARVPPFSQILAC